MTHWDFLWQPATGLLLDSNDDGLIDGVAAYLIPLQAEQFTAQLWAATANLAARIGLETPALHLPLIGDPQSVKTWQIPLLLSFGATADALNATSWSTALGASTCFASVDQQVVWLEHAGRRALWVHGATETALAQLLNQMASDATETPVIGEKTEGEKTEDRGTEGQNTEGQKTTLDWAKLYTSDTHGLFTAWEDGHTPDECRVQIVLGPATDKTAGMAAVDLAARLGLETAGLRLPLVTATAPDLPGLQNLAGLLFLLGFPAEPSAAPSGSVATQLHPLSPNMAHYLAETYPYLDTASQRVGDEQRALDAIVACVRELTQGHSRLLRLALAETQAARSLHWHTPGADATASLQRLVFHQVWNPPDGLDDVARVRALFFTQTLPALVNDPLLNAGRVTVFCDAPANLRQNLAAEFTAALAAQTISTPVQVLPVHKAGLAWLLEQQAPLLAQQPVARLLLHFHEFQPVAGEKCLDLPTRHLQEVFPADTLLCQRLGLAPEQFQWQMMPSTNQLTNPTHQPIPAYRLEAYTAQDDLLYSAELHLLTGQRLYMAALPVYGLVHPATGGVIVQGQSGNLTAWPVATDTELFWDFYQEAVLPAMRRHILEIGQGRPTPEGEPYFDRLEVHGYFGGPDEALGLYEEFISLGEALHEDIYFNTLDYLAALGESFGGRAIEAAGQVLPWIHDYYDAAGTPIPPSQPRATVTLHAWQVPTRLPDLGLTVGDRRDLPMPQALRLGNLAVTPDGKQVARVTVEVGYADDKQARFAGQVLARWQRLAGTQTGFPAGVEVTIACCRGETAVATVVFPVQTAPSSSAAAIAAEAAAVDSAVIGPQQLLGELDAVAQLPGVQVWQVGQSYQGRPGYAVDVTLPLAPQQTHQSRLKLTVQKPTCFLIARHHANEVSSTTTAFQMVRDFTTNPALRAWLKRVNLVFLPIANPDGAAAHYRMMAEHPRWKHHAARFNAAGKEISRDLFDPLTPFGEARFRRTIWERWLPDAIVDNHGVPSHEWCQPFAGFTTPPRFPVCYHLVQAMLYGIVTFADDPMLPQHRQAAEALRTAVAKAVAATPWLFERNQHWLKQYCTYGHDWLPDLSPVDVHEGMLFFFQGAAPARQPNARRSFAMRYPQITLLDWITEVPDETAQGAYLEECAAAHYVANQAMIELVAKSAAPQKRFIRQEPSGQTTMGWQRARTIRLVDGVFTGRR